MRSTGRQGAGAAVLERAGAQAGRLVNNSHVHRPAVTSDERESLRWTVVVTATPMSHPHTTPCVRTCVCGRVRFALAATLAHAARA